MKAVCLATRGPQSLRKILKHFVALGLGWVKSNYREHWCASQPGPPGPSDVGHICKAISISQTRSLRTDFRQARRGTVAEGSSWGLYLVAEFEVVSIKD